MDLLLDQESFQRRYNCSFYDTEIIPLESREHEFMGGFILLCYTTFMVLYIPCIYAMFTCEHHHRAAYRLMALLGCFHIGGLQASGLAAGFFGFTGGVFCVHPWADYAAGVTAMCTWCASTLTSMILGLNRCCELYDSRLAYTLFNNQRMLLFWRIFPIGFCIFVATTQAPVLYSSVLMTWFFNPHLGYFDDFGVTYHNNFHAAWNLSVCVGESSIYTLLICLYWRAGRSASAEVRTALRREKKIYIQVFLVGMIHFVASLSHVLIQYMPVKLWITYVATLFYLFSQGFPSVIYLSINRTIRNTLMHKLRGHPIPSHKSTDLSAAAAVGPNEKTLPESSFEI